MRVSCPDFAISSEDSLADIWTLWMESTRTVMPVSFVKRLASSASFASEEGA